MDFSEFDKKFAEKVRLSSRTFKENVNRGALDLAHRALKNTMKADRQTIKALPESLGLTQKGGSRWYAYVRKRLQAGASFSVKRKGVRTTKLFKGPGTRQAIAQLSRKIIASRLRGIAFLKSGWLPAIRKLDALVRDKVRGNSIGGARQFGPDHGYAVPATSELHPVAQVINSVFLSEKAQAIGLKGFQAAVDSATAEMERHAKGKLRGIWNGR